MSYILEPNEGILQQSIGATVEGLEDIEYSRVMLTSKYIVFLDETDDEDIVLSRIPLGNIRVYQDMPQVFIRDESYPKLDIYLSDNTIQIDFDGFRSSKKKEICQQWIVSISTAISDMRNANVVLNPMHKVFCQCCGNRIDGPAIYCMYCGAKL